MDKKAKVMNVLKWISIGVAYLAVNVLMTDQAEKLWGEDVAFFVALAEISLITLIVAALFFVLDMNYVWAKNVNYTCSSYAKMVAKWEQRHCKAIYHGVKDAVADLNRQILKQGKKNDR